MIVIRPDPIHVSIPAEGHGRDDPEPRANDSPAETLVPDLELEYDDKGDYDTIIAERTKNTFVGRDKSKLEIRRLLSDKKLSNQGYLSWPTENESFGGLERVKDFAEEEDRCQIYYIKQKNSHSKLWIDKELLDRVIDSYTIFLRFWDQVFNFGPKAQQSDVCHAPFRYRRSKRIGDNGHLDECTYGLSYTERNGRNADCNKDHEPWSVRQCAVYQQYDSSLDRVVFVIIAPSNKGQKRIERALQRLSNTEQRLNPFDLHRMLISTALANWRWYIRSLEDRMSAQVERLILADVQDEDEKLSPLVDFQINFGDRQRLKVLEDRVLDLKIIFDSLLHTIQSIEKRCNKAHADDTCKGGECDCLGIAAEFEEQIQEVKVNQKKIETLQMRAQGTADLLSDLLDYENTHALKVLAKESKDLAEKNSKDAAAINIVIIITLVYLPVTVVAGIFSSQLIAVDENGHVSVASGAWWFAALSIPLTIITLVAWRAWVAWAMWIDTRRQRKKLKMATARSQESLELEGTLYMGSMDPEEGSLRPEVRKNRILGRFRKKVPHSRGIFGPP